MGEGLFSPWHIAIIAFVVFMVFGPKKIADRFTDISQGVQHLMDDDGDGEGAGPSTTVDAPPPAPKKEKLARRMGRWLHHKRSGRKRRRAASS